MLTPNHSLHNKRYLADRTLINKKPYKYQKLVKICTFQYLVKRTISIVTSFSDRWSDVLLSCWADFQHVYGTFENGVFPSPFSTIHENTKTMEIRTKTSFTQHAMNDVWHHRISFRFHSISQPFQIKELHFGDCFRKPAVLFCRILRLRVEGRLNGKNSGFKNIRICVDGE